MQVSRRAFLGGAAAMALLRDGFAATSADARIFAPNGGQAADFLICRRLYLDICGRIPTPEEVNEYVASRDIRKREKLVDMLLDSDDYADYYAMRYCDFLRAVTHRTPEGISEAVSTSLLLEPTAKYARFFSRVAYKKTREWKEEIVYLDDGPADATPEAFMAELEGPLAEQFVATPVQRVHWWIYGTLAKRAELDRWKAAFRSGGYRLKPLLRYVFSQTDYRKGPGKGGFPSRRLDAEVLDDVLCTLTGARRDFGSIAPEPYSFLPPTRKSVLVEDGSISSAFLILFGRPARDSGLLEERNNRITAKQRLYLYNSSKLWRDLGVMVGKKEISSLSHADQIRELYMRFLSRPPVKDELFYFDQKNKITARDVAWFLLNSREFLYRI